MEEKKSFVLYARYNEQIKMLSLDERGELLTAIFSYAAGEEICELSPLVKMLFSIIKDQMDSDAEKWEKRVEAGKNGGAPRGNQNARKNENNRKQPKTTENNLKQPKTTENNLEQPKTTENKQKQAKQPVYVDVVDNVDVDVTDNVVVDDTVTDTENEKDKKNLDSYQNLSKKKAPAVFFPDDELLDQTFKDFIKHRKTLKSPMTDRAIQLAISKLEEMAMDECGVFDRDKAVRIINQSIERGWKGFFELKETPVYNNKDQPGYMVGGKVDWSKV